MQLTLSDRDADLHGRRRAYLPDPKPELARTERHERGYPLLKRREPAELLLQEQPHSVS